jgi:hypothetical protein
VIDVDVVTDDAIEDDGFRIDVSFRSFPIPIEAMDLERILMVSRVREISNELGLRI